MSASAQGITTKAADLARKDFSFVGAFAQTDIKKMPILNSQNPNHVMGM